MQLKQTKRQNKEVVSKTNIFASSDICSVIVVDLGNRYYFVEFEGDFNPSCFKQNLPTHNCTSLDYNVYSDLVQAFTLLTTMYSNPIGFYQNTPSFLIGFCLSRGYNLQALNIFV